MIQKKIKLVCWLFSIAGIIAVLAYLILQYCSPVKTISFPLLTIFFWGIPVILLGGFVLVLLEVNEEMEPNLLHFTIRKFRVNPMAFNYGLLLILVLGIAIALDRSGNIGNTRMQPHLITPEQRINSSLGFCFPVLIIYAISAFLLSPWNRKKAD
jgi:hypothetical protein